MASVAILCPVAESVNPITFQYAMAMVSHSTNNGMQIKQVGVTQRTLVHSARNQLAKGFLKTDCDWAFWMDADMVLPSDTLIRLMETAEAKNAQFVTAVYYQRLGEHFPVLWKKDPLDLEGNRMVSDPKAVKDKREAYRHHYLIPKKDATFPFRADVCGFGAVLTHKEMFEKIPFPYFKTISDDCSEDFYFCIEAKKAGYILWVDPRPMVGHVSNPPIVTKNTFSLPHDRLKPIQVATQ